MTRTEIAIIGAGFAGLGVAAALRRAGREDFVILERGASVGGTWRDNTYPGISCDVPSHLYCFAAHPNPSWSATYAPGVEIHRYLEQVAAREELGDRLRLRTPLLGADWDDGASLWHIDTGAEPVVSDVLVLACGRLTEPHVPEVEGLEGFAGPIFHTARWDHGVELANAHVAVVGTGASGVQLVPELTRLAGHVTLFQRTPAWILPRGGETYEDIDHRRFAAPGMLARLRARLYGEGEARFASRSGDAAASQRAQRAALDHLESQVADPALRAALTPDYAFGCKRVLLSDAFYPAVASDAVTLVSARLAAVEDGVLVAADGARVKADVLVLATGFHATRQPYAELVRGDDGVSLAAHWADGMTAFASTVVPGFPNLFVLNGPNASLGHNSSVLMIEEQAAYVVRALAIRDRRDDGVLRTRFEAEAAYTAEIATAAVATPWITGGCTNWYVDERSGRLTLLWPGTVQAFRERLAAADGSEFEPVIAPAWEKGSTT